MTTYPPAYDDLPTEPESDALEPEARICDRLRQVRDYVQEMLDAEAYTNTRFEMDAYIRACNDCIQKMEPYEAELAALRARLETAEAALLMVRNRLPIGGNPTYDLSLTKSDWDRIEAALLSLEATAPDDDEPTDVEIVRAGLMDDEMWGRM